METKDANEPLVVEPIDGAIHVAAPGFEPELADERSVHRRLHVDAAEIADVFEPRVAALDRARFGAHEVGEADVSVRELVKDCEANVVGEVDLPIEQCLITVPGAKLEDITAVYSHDAALTQCSRFLQEKVPNAKRVEHEDTAGAAADVKRWGNPHFAAIASRAAAELHGLHVLAANIGNDRERVTKFLVINAAPITKTFTIFFI